ncbi:MAG TPA: hypothetical protein VGJ87_00555, partial [Roseiflexaceae bacterium]
GVVLYEMLTGRVPFEGESVAEILMKHLTSPPDLTKVPRDYVGIVGKALAKNPAHRYASMAEMAKAIETLNSERQGRAPAAKAVPPVARPVPAALPMPKPAPQPARMPELPIVTAHPVYTLRCQLAELSGSLSMTALLAVVFCTLWAAVAGARDLASIGSLFFLTVAVCWTVLIPSKFWSSQAKGDQWARRVVMMVLGAGLGLGAMWLYGWTPQTAGAEALPVVALGDHQNWSALATSEGLTTAAGYVSYFGLAFCAVRWWKMAERRRSSRFSFFPVLAAGFWAMVLLFVWPAQEAPMGVGAGALVMAAAIVQLVSPWEQPPPPASKRMRLRCA